MFLLYIMCLITLQPWIRPVTSVVMERNFPIKDLAICTKEYCKTICCGTTMLVSGSVWLVLWECYWIKELIFLKADTGRREGLFDKFWHKKSPYKWICSRNFNHGVPQSILDQTLGHNMVIFFIEFRYWKGVDLFSFLFYTRCLLFM